ncbi:hypothetical protein CAEBREN_24284 [Caenorhabditis brenneri]|uniref:Uncharacterized protein n=1 Tax=Caenorhabditis brenneri TaxID=135651 RepID=G0PHI0_CAEBE|nr:hypothetical protein CAEBREN_24284 [Caenorhabditis brenneri]
MLSAISAIMERCPPAASTRGGRLSGMADDYGGGDENFLRNPYLSTSHNQRRRRSSVKPPPRGAKSSPTSGRCQDPFSGVPLPPVQLQQPSQNWPIDLLRLQSQPTMHQVQSASEFGSIGYAGTNPFEVAPPPLLSTFPPAPFRAPFAVSSALPTSAND